MDKKYIHLSLPTSKPSHIGDHEDQVQLNRHLSYLPHCFS